MNKKKKKRLLCAGLAVAGIAIVVALGAKGKGLGAKGKLSFNRKGYYRDDPDDNKWYDGGPDDDAIDMDDPEFYSSTDSRRMPEESDEDYQERMADLYGD